MENLDATPSGAKRCYIADQSNYIHLGFYNGVHPTNTDKLIEGSGKNLRHIKTHLTEG